MCLRGVGVNTGNSKGLDSKCPGPSPVQAAVQGLGPGHLLSKPLEPPWNLHKIPIGFQAVGPSVWNTVGPIWTVGLEPRRTYYD